MDHYLTKPFEPKELLFRIKALLLRQKKKQLP
ncbi:osmolarity response regulator [Bacillus subtilis]|nr:osmolarity response regulator [Bacillus subtilis]